MKDRRRDTRSRYYSPGQLTGHGSQSNPVHAAPKAKHGARKFIFFLVCALLVGGVYVGIKGSAKTTTYHRPQVATKTVTQPAKPAAPVTTPCSQNTDPKTVIVSISQQHLWACNYTTVAYNSAVTTGYVNNPADKTPLGTFYIFTKEANVTLRGSDGSSTWNDPVHYWMPFLFNQYGAYGFHDAPWRTPNQFGQVSIETPNASHGCIECPTATAAFLYGWVVKGMPVHIVA